MVSQCYHIRIRAGRAPLWASGEGCCFFEPGCGEGGFDGRPKSGPGVLTLGGVSGFQCGWCVGSSVELDLGAP